MPSFKEMYKPALLSAKNLGKKTITTTIEAIYPEFITGNTGTSTERLVIEWDEGMQRLALNKTNGNILCKAFGDDYGEWVGKRIKISTVKTQYMGQTVDGLLVEPVKK